MKNDIVTYANTKCEEIGISNLEECFFDTNDLSQFLRTGRTNASKLANDLVAKNVLFKINTRPVLFAIKERFEEHFLIPVKDVYESISELKTDLEPNSTDSILQKMIGYDMSLSDAVEQMKTAVFYPGRGLPMMITGDTGVGKFFCSYCLSVYEKKVNVIHENAPFKVLNCAQYHNNPELLSGILFGYVKGAFTGADEDRNGLLQDADGGVLFLDEVHRLPPEGQEKLFVYMDGGTYSRVGETIHHASNVRLVFATTEGKEDFLETFMRRIPIHIHIPNIEERGILEKNKLSKILSLAKAKTLARLLMFLLKSLVLHKYSQNILNYYFLEKVKKSYPKLSSTFPERSSC